MPELYPETINSDVQRQGYRHRPGNNVLKSSFLSGPPQSRRRTTKRIDSHEITLIFTREELDIFELWYSETLKDGSLSFYFPNPKTKIEGTFKFDGQYEDSHIGGLYWSVKFRLIEL